ncbi:MAG: MarR family transcriptional regulator [Halieaceae bacterium]|jgi:DNA-binding MarR family transcriptional regulator|nr:MarR family transcriptional regulator [Halieaceae bacterium]
MSNALDSESRIKDDDHLALKLWLRLLTCTNMVEGVLRQNLRRDFDSTLPRFDLLAQLDRHPEKLTMGDLSRLMMVSGGNVTGLVKQLEEEGLVNRVPRKTDRRTYLVGLTARGKRHFDQMAGEHEGWIAQLFAGLDHAQQEALMDALAALKNSVRQGRL